MQFMYQLSNWLPSAAPRHAHRLIVRAVIEQWRGWRVVVLCVLQGQSVPGTHEMDSQVLPRRT